VLGATVTNIVSSLSSQFVVLVILSLFIAIPVSWWLMNRWLEDFAYHIEIQWWMFALIGVAAMLTALITVSFRSIRAATANPVDSLRNE
jgi:putative ABC transport system permease protein